jgi:hypothetical protein
MSDVLDQAVVETPNRDQAERFLAALDPDTKRFTFQTFDDVKGRKDETLKGIVHGTLAQRWKYLVNLNKRGAGIFVTINRTDLRGRETGNIYRRSCRVCRPRRRAARSSIC